MTPDNAWETLEKRDSATLGANYRLAESPANERLHSRLDHHEDSYNGGVP
jgi:hypothetical protein